MTKKSTLKVDKLTHAVQTSPFLPLDKLAMRNLLAREQAF